MRLFSPIRLVHKLAVITLAFWLAGAGCLLGCEGMAASASSDEHLNLTSSSNQSSTLIVEGDACASSEGHSCCKKKTRVAKKQPRTAPDSVHPHTDLDLTSRKLNESSSSGVRACPFAMSRALAVAKLRDGHTDSTAGPSHVLPAQVVRVQKLALSAMSPLPNRGHTYLHCCSFLI